MGCLGASWPLTKVSFVLFPMRKLGNHCPSVISMACLFCSMRCIESHDQENDAYMLLLFYFLASDVITNWIWLLKSIFIFFNYGSCVKLKKIFETLPCLSQRINSRVM